MRWKGWCGLWLLICLLPFPAEARWLQAETANFRVYGNVSERTVRDMAVLLEDFDQLLRFLTGTKAPPSDRKLDIYLLKNVRDLQLISPGVASDISGFYVATPNGIAAFSTLDRDYGAAGDDTLLHEYAHHFMLQYYPTAYPAWYIEGFAEYVMTAKFKKDVIEFGGTNIGRAYALYANPWIPTESLFYSDFDTLKGTAREMYYPESWLVVHYLSRVEGKGEALKTFLAAVARGEDMKTSFVSAIGMDHAAFDAILKRYMEKNMTYSRLKRTGEHMAAAVTVSPLPDSTQDLLLARAALRLKVSTEDQPALLARVRTAAARYPGDRFAASVLAHAEVTIGDRETGVAQLDQLIAADARDSEDPDAGMAIARRWLGKAYKIDSTHYPTLLAFVDAQPQVPLSENAINALLGALKLAPQVEMINIRAGIALMGRKDFVWAEQLLTSVASNPHGGGYSKVARRLLEQARRHEAVAVEAIHEEPENAE